jgi:probable FeS assembly SUF system protein SufT
VNSDQVITVKRDVNAALIPLGTPVTIPEGSEVHIVQELGGSYTVSVNSNLVRVAGKDADALGMQQAAPEPADAEIHPDADGPVNMDEVWEILKTCYDPEIPVNVVDLGLIYSCQLNDKGQFKGLVIVTMTLTAPGCGMGPFIVDDVRTKVASVKNVTDVHVELVFDPPWDRAMMSDEARLQLGMF